MQLHHTIFILSLQNSFYSKMSVKQSATNSKLANLLIKEFQYKIQANSQTDCEIKQKTGENSETLPIHHE